jgi:catechol 2,3-dioxygenase-like lactoylglutathione lyase family enzyme
MADVGEMYGVWHWSFTVSDLDAAVEFYTTLLGFECIHRQRQSNEYTRRLVGYPDADLRVAQLRIPGARRSITSHDLELVEYVAPRGTRQDPGICHPGAAHLALTVGDIAERYDRLLAAGVRFFSEPNLITAGVNEGGFTVYFYGPDQIVHELVQPPRSRIEEATG